MAAKYAKDQPAGFTNRIEKVAIVGAGGRVGKYIAEALVKTGKHTVTALTREGSQGGLAAGVVPVIISYDDDEGMAAALRGQQFLIITMSVFAPRDSQSKLIRAAARAGVPYVMPNWYGGDPEDEALINSTLLGPAGAAARQEIEELGVSAWVALCCSFWYEFSLAGTPIRYGFDFKDRSLVLYDEGDVRICTTTWDQCGRALVALLSLPELPRDEAEEAAGTTLTLSRFRNRPVYIKSFVLSQRDMLASVLRVTGTAEADWKISRVPSAESYARGAEEFKAGDMAGFGRMLYSRAFFPDSCADFSAKVQNELLGLPEEDLDERTKVAVEMAKADSLFPGS